MRGGKALIFVDPMAAVDAMQMEGMPQGMPPMGQSSDLPALFESWGIGYASDQVVADAELALAINTGMTRRPTRHLGYLGVNASHMSGDDIITAELNVVNLAMAGRLTVTDASGLTLEPLLTSSPSASMMDASRFTFLPDPAVLQDGFAADGIEYVVAGRISGTLPSAFPNGPPATTVSTDEETGAGDQDAEGHLAESAEPVNIILVADVDMLGDAMWVQTQSFFGQQIANAFASNGAFVINALENLSGSSDLIGVRSRASYTRPFTRVLQLQGEAEARFRETEQRLQNQLAETESRLGELQSSREDTGTVLLTEQQRAEIDRFINQRTEIRRELRAVQRGLDRDIERLGTVLKLINIGLVPLLLTVFVLFAVWRRSRGARS
jgi:ABC-type uncharacterized transport system involved in gliding motility auxiliary subunit